MPEDKNSKLLQPPRSSNHTKKKKKKKVSSAPCCKEKHLGASLPPGISSSSSSSSLLPNPGSVQTQDQLPKLGDTSYGATFNSGQKIKKHQMNSQTLHQTCEKQVLEPMGQLSIQNRESLRWEGVLQDPHEEAKRLELYRANRRQRYIAQREVKDT